MSSKSRAQTNGTANNETGPRSGAQHPAHWQGWFLLSPLAGIVILLLWCIFLILVFYIVDILSVASTPDEMNKYWQNALRFMMHSFCLSNFQFWKALTPKQGIKSWLLLDHAIEIDNIKTALFYY